MAISFAACGSDDTPDPGPGPGPEPPVTTNERTVLVYMAADNNYIISLNTTSMR